MENMNDKLNESIKILEHAKKKYDSALKSQNEAEEFAKKCYDDWALALGDHNYVMSEYIKWVLNNG